MTAFRVGTRRRRSPATPSHGNPERVRAGAAGTPQGAGTAGTGGHRCAPGLLADEVTFP
jgi:hypothetical protein